MKHIHPLGIVLGLGIVAGCADVPTQIPASSPPSSSSSYLLLLRDTVSDAAVTTAQAIADANITDRSGGATAGWGVALTDSAARRLLAEDDVELLPSLHGAVLEATPEQVVTLRGDPRVEAIEPIRPVTLFAASLLATRSWALDRINQSGLPLDGRTTRFGGDGLGVRIAIFDSGIRWTHVDLVGRVAGGFDAFTNAPKVSGDPHGHGTLVASLAAGTSYGTAPSATLLDVRVMNASGTGSSLELARGVDWVLAEKKRVTGPMVANMSLGFVGGSTVIDALVERLRGAGIVVVVAAGNEGRDACTVSPARAPGAITVAATANGAVDTRPPYSNGGACVDVSAPGDAVPGAGAIANAALVSASGTSMSAPFVAGAAATYLGVNKTATPDAVATWLLAESVVGKISGLLPNTSNRLLTLQRLPGVAAPVPAPAPTPAPTPTPAPPPTNTFALTSSCVARTCTINASVPTGVAAANVPQVVYTWTLTGAGTSVGTNLRRLTVTFGSAATMPISVSAKLGTTVLGTATTTLTVR